MPKNQRWEILSNQATGVRSPGECSFAWGTSARSPRRHIPGKSSSMRPPRRIRVASDAAPSSESTRWQTMSDLRSSQPLQPDLRATCAWTQDPRPSCSCCWSQSPRRRLAIRITSPRRSTRRLVRACGRMPTLLMGSSAGPTAATWAQRCAQYGSGLPRELIRVHPAGWGIPTISLARRVMSGPVNRE